MKPARILGAAKPPSAKGDPEPPASGPAVGGEEPPVPISDSGKETSAEGGDTVAVGFKGEGVGFGADEQDLSAGIEGVGADFDSLLEDLADFCFEATDAGSADGAPAASGDVDAGELAVDQNQAEMGIAPGGVDAGIVGFDAQGGAEDFAQSWFGHADAQGAYAVEADLCRGEGRRARAREAPRRRQSRRRRVIRRLNFLGDPHARALHPDLYDFALPGVHFVRDTNGPILIHSHAAGDNADGEGEIALACLGHNPRAAGGAGRYDHAVKPPDLHRAGEGEASLLIHLGLQ